MMLQISSLVLGMLLSSPMGHAFVPPNPSSWGKPSAFATTTTTTTTTTHTSFLSAAAVEAAGLNGDVNGHTSSDDEPYFSIESSTGGPGGSAVHRLTFHRLPGQASDLPPLALETGRIGRQAAGAVTLTRGDSVVYVTASRDDKPRDEIDFLPLSVEHQERFSSAGLTSGSYSKRDGRPAEHEILTCRLIDRPVRPLIEAGWRHETQILSWVLSYDGVRSCDPLAIVASSAALYLSDVPLRKPVAAVQVGLTADGADFLLNPTNEQMKTSPLHLIVAGTADAVLMIEGAADFLPEDRMLAAIEFGHAAIRVLCQGLEAFGQAVGVVKNYSTIASPPEGLQQRVDDLYADKVDAMYAMGGTKSAQGDVMSTLSKDVVEVLGEEFPDSTSAIKSAFKDLLCRRMFVRAKESGTRCDGRGLAEIRQIDVEAGLLPRVHGSALFTRGETQALATATLGDSGMRQKMDTIDGPEEKRFYLQYTFPPSSVGETGRVGSPGRREVGHGNLAERALVAIVPPEDKFPYSIRVESLITESHGSSSMASVCGGCLALMDAGVPISQPVAGIAMGMLLGDKGAVSDENAVILSDISGTEDALGTMDFKVAGGESGITTFQLDIKCEGLTLETLAQALEQARVGRLHILEEMKKVLPEVRENLPPTVPKMLVFEIPYESIGKVIGPGGKQIRAIIEDFELSNMDVNDEGRIQVSSFSQEKLVEAKNFVLNMLNLGANGAKKERPKYVGPDPVAGETYTGKITGIHPFGVFVEFMPGAEDGSTPGLEGLVHVSELARERVRNCEGFIRSMGAEELTVKYLGMEKGKIRLSRKAVLEEKYGGGGGGGGPNGSNRAGGSNNNNNRGGGNRKRAGAQGGRAPPRRPPATMSDAELDVIAQAIDGVANI